MGCRKLQIQDCFQLVDYHHEAPEVHEDDLIVYRKMRFITYDPADNLLTSRFTSYYSSLRSPNAKSNNALSRTEWFNQVMSITENGKVIANYDYNPFGRVAPAGSSNTAISKENSFRFSSEYHDDETGLVYYNYRYYSPELGRWLSRDPLGERGRRNLYGFISNNSISNWGLLGQGVTWYWKEVGKGALSGSFDYSFPFVVGYGIIAYGKTWVDVNISWMRMNNKNTR